ncbi:MAG TPA: HNH endonuclease signature motif containing protein, partial [Microbacterium sp.]|uniref:HNH endonuclease signature motif containing protein n=1 Tax=Microbacterium sp. TaxID=51671 RepID=UPI002B4666D8
LSVRDGGCAWPACDRPASSCEAHHIDPYSNGGRTDIDRGILLCRFHHMNLHHHHWRITRTGTGQFVLHSPDPDTEPIVLHPRLERRCLFGDLQPPPTRFRPAA